VSAVIHSARLAWDGARTLVRAAERETTFAAVAQHIAEVLPPAYWSDYVATRDRLLRPDRDDVVCLEAGAWRVRLEELLLARPELVTALAHLTDEAAARLRKAAAGAA